MQINVAATGQPDKKSYFEVDYIFFCLPSILHVTAKQFSQQVKPSNAALIWMLCYSQQDGKDVAQK